MRYFKLILLFSFLTFSACEDEDELEIKPSQLIIFGQAYPFSGAYITNFGVADSNASSPYSGTKIQLDLYTSGLSYDRDEGFKGKGFLIKLQLFSPNSNLREGTYRYSRNQAMSTYDNALIIEYPETGSPRAIYPNEFNQLTVSALAGGQVQLSGAFISNDRDITFNYVGGFVTYP